MLTTLYVDLALRIVDDAKNFRGIVKIQRKTIVNKVNVSQKPST